MRKKKVWSGFLGLMMAGALLCQAAGCGSIVEQPEASSENGNSGIEPTGKDSEQKTDERFADSYMNFALELFQESVKESTGENVLIAPFSVQLALAMSANGANGETKTQMEEVISSGMTIEELNEYWGDYLNGSDKTQLKIANSIWIRDEDENIQIEEGFIEKNASYYGAEILKKPFDQQTLADINQWISDHTDGMIENMLDRMDSSSVVYLVNALAFEGEWKEVYSSDQVSDGIFTTEAGEKQTVSMMYSSENYYLEGKNATGFMKKYKDGKYSFVALLPKEGMSIEEYVSGLDAKTLQDTLESKQITTVDTCLPKFSCDYGISMRQILEDMGMEAAFDHEAADFSKLGTISQGNIYLDEVLHRSFITVDELGTKAGAATVVAKDGCALIETPEVYLDHPFFYMILDDETNLPVFMGIVTNFAE